MANFILLTTSPIAHRLYVSDKSLYVIVLASNYLGNLHRSKLQLRSLERLLFFVMPP